MHPTLRFNAIPNLPAVLEPLREIAFNLWWSWSAQARWLYWYLDPALWERTLHSPLKMLQRVSQARLEAVARDEDYLTVVRNIYREFKSYLSTADTWARQRSLPFSDTRPVAYFSAEFGFHESIPIYSGGLGILSGDHTKSASDLGLPFVGVSMLYRHGYFKQQITREGRQEAIDLNQNFRELPIRETVRNGGPLSVTLALPDGPVVVKVWQMSIGRVTLYLLDTDVPENSPLDRHITAQLYGGDKEMRIKQEIVLGIGGKRALHALDIDPLVFHINEGHSAFLSLERIRRRVQHQGLNFEAAAQIVAASNVFTTHTPVPAGNEVFSGDLIRRYFANFAVELHISAQQLMALGQPPGDGHADEFSMTILALKTSRHANGVSRIHGAVSRSMWRNIWPGVPEDEVPITSITNGIHTRSWLAPEIAALYERYLGADWDQHLNDVDYWRGIIDIPANELWETHEKLKARLIDFARVRLRRQRERNNESPERLREVNHLLDPEILTIGFARRFATYKRALLLFSQPDRLRALLDHPERPVQLIFAGKAHPHDRDGQEFIRRVIEFSQSEEFRERLIFIEDYDACIGRRLCQGVDLWLNTPLRPMEASGTSGMKGPPNGALNFSVLDGWWAEAWNRNNGWAIGEEIKEGSVDFQNEVDVASLYSVLENQVVPLFYARPDGRLPVAWIHLMRESMRSVVPRFNTHRMVQGYCERLYEPAAAAGEILTSNACLPARMLRDWKEDMCRRWDEVRIEEAELGVPDSANVPVGQPVRVVARVRLGEIRPEHVTVQACIHRGEGGQTEPVGIVPLEWKNSGSNNGLHLFEGSLEPADSGEFSLAVRVVPTHPLLIQAHELRLIRWH
ncbi:MAG: alpha-glucan family phosphorylase [Verrucomicrobiales bacterium]